MSTTACACDHMHKREAGGRWGSPAPCGHLWGSHGDAAEKETRPSLADILDAWAVEIAEAWRRHAVRGGAQ